MVGRSETKKGGDAEGDFCRTRDRESIPCRPCAKSLI